MKHVSLLAIVLFAGLLVACESSAPANTDTQTPTGDNAQSADPAAPADEKSNTDAKDAFATAFEGAVEYTASYDLTSSDGKNTYSSTMTQYINARDLDNYRFRTDSQFEGVESQTYIVGDTYTTCTKMSGKWTCYSPQTTDTEETETSNPTEDAQEAAGEDTSVVVRDGTMQIAGVSAECFLITVEDGSTRYCIYKAVPLYVKSMDGKGNVLSEMKATSFKSTTSSSDFVPPAKPTAMPAYDPAGGTWPTGEVPEGYDLPSY